MLKEIGWRTRVVGLLVNNRHERLDVATDVEVANNSDPARPDLANEGIEDLVDDGLVEDVLVAKVVQVKLQRFQFGN